MINSDNNIMIMNISWPDESLEDWLFEVVGADNGGIGSVLQEHVKVAGITGVEYRALSLVANKSWGHGDAGLTAGLTGYEWDAGWTEGYRNVLRIFWYEKIIYEVQN